MNITVNGETKDIQEGTTIQILLEQLGLNPKTIVVQRNQDIIERADYNTAHLNHGDTLDLVQFVGGG